VRKFDLGKGGRHWLIALLGLIPHLPGLWGDFVYDDFRFVRDNPGVHDLERPAEFLTSIGRACDPADRDIYRPLRTLGFALQYRVFGPHAAGFHAVSLVLLLCTVRAFLFLLASLSPTTPRLHAAGALLFAVHPLTVECVAWISSQGDLWAALFLFLSLGHAARSVKSHRPNLETAATSIFGALAMLGKESAILLAPAAAVICVYRSRRAGLRLASRQILRLTAALVGITAGYLLLRQSILERDFSLSAGALAQTDIVPAAALFTCARNWNLFIQLFAFPARLSIDYGDGYLPPAGSISLLVAILLYAVLLFLARWSRERSCTRLCLSLALLLFLPTSGLIALKSPTAERFFFLSCAFLAAFVVFLFAAWLTGRRLLLLGIVLAAFAVRTAQRTLDFRDQESLFAAEQRVHPSSAQALLGLGEVEWQRGDVARATVRFQMVLDLLPPGNPRRVGALYNLGALADENGEPAVARAFWERACHEVRGSPKEAMGGIPSLWLRLAERVRKDGDPAQALELLREGRTLFPGSLDLLELIGICLDQQGRALEAVEAYSQAHARGRRTASLAYHHALALHHLGEELKALGLVERALLIDPMLASAHRLRETIVQRLSSAAPEDSSESR